MSMVECYGNTDIYQSNCQYGCVLQSSKSRRDDYLFTQQSIGGDDTIRNWFRIVIDIIWITRQSYSWDIASDVRELE